jgi:hypothetical protein
MNIHYIMEGKEGVPDWIKDDIVAHADHVSACIVQSKCCCTWFAVMAAASAPTSALAATAATATARWGANNKYKRHALTFVY